MDYANSCRIPAINGWRWRSGSVNVPRMLPGAQN